MSSYYEKILATGEVKCIDEEVPFEIPQGWKWCRLNEVATSVTDFVASGSFASLRENVKYYSTKEYALLVRTKDLSCNFSNDLVYTDKHGYDFLSNSNLFGGELILPNIGASIGKVFIVPNLNMPMTLAPNSVMIRLDDECTKSWLYNVFSSPFGYDTLWSISSSTAQGKFNKTDFRKVLVPIPPIEEQNRIVTKIKELSPYIEKYSKAQEHLDVWNVAIKEILQKSILQEAIQGKLVPQIAEEGTAQELLEQIKTEKQKLVKEGKLKKSALNDSIIFRGDDNKYYELIDNSPVCIDEFLPFQIPETWTWCKVKDLLEIQTGASFKKEQANANKKGIRILRGGNILPNKYIFKDDDVFVSEEFVNANTILKKNCIITPAVTSLENIGKMAVIEKDYNNVSAGGFVFIISPYIQDFNHSLLLAYFLQSPFLIEAMRGITKKSGAAFYNLGKERLKELYLPLPPMTEQSRIVSKINEILSSIMSR